jgi:hypothetical protein
MIVGFCSVFLYIPGNNSLKGKRVILKSLKEKIRNRFNVSVAEVDSQDKLQLATLGISCISSDSKHANQILSKVVNLIENTEGDFQLVDYKIEMR